MADNSVLPVNSGTETFANDDIGGVKYPRIKVTQGADGSSTDVSSAAPLFSKLSDGTNAVAVKAASTAPGATDPALVVAISPNSINSNGQAIMTGSAPVVIASDDPVAVSLALIDDIIKTDDAAFTPATSKVAMAGFQADESSTDSVDEGDAGAARMTLDRKLINTPQPHTKGGLLAFNSLDLDETEEDIKTSAGQVYYINATNRTTSVRYLRFYNATAANTTVGTTATFLGPFTIPANASDYTVLNLGFGGHGVEFDTAICASVTTGFAANDTGAPGANDCIVNVLYK